MARCVGIVGPAAITLGMLLLLELASWMALRVVPEPERDVRFVFDEVWSHTRNPYHRPDRDLFWSLIPHYSQGLVRINSEGFRGREFARDKPAGTYRVVVMGDSATFGYGVVEEATYARQLEERLGRLGGSDAARRRVEVINAGVIGYTSWQGRMLYERTISRVAPDLVVAMFGYNDHHSALQLDSERYRRRYLAAAVGTLAGTSTFGLMVRLRELTVGTDLQQAPVVRTTVEEFADNLLALRQSAAADGARTLFLTVPLRQGTPLVENFRAVDYDEDGRRKRVWMRQIDLAMRILPVEAGAVVRRHFLDSSASLSAFTQDAAACALSRGMAARYPDFAIFWYLSAACGTSADGDAAARRAGAASVDHERREMDAYNARLRELAATSCIEILDVAALFRTRDSREVLLDVMHPTDAGHGLIARMIAAWIMER